MIQITTVPIKITIVKSLITFLITFLFVSPNTILQEMRLHLYQKKNERDEIARNKKEQNRGKWTFQ